MVTELNDIYLLGAKICHVQRKQLWLSDSSVPIVTKEIPVLLLGDMTENSAIVELQW